MKDITIRKFQSKDCERVLELNEESVHFLSPLTEEKLYRLAGQSEMFDVLEVDGVVEAFVLTFREGSAYDSVNYLWFENTFENFMYVDRVVVSVKMQGNGLGKMLYKVVFDHAKSTGVARVTAEIDIQPPNPGSLIFHEKFGFEEVGQQSVYDGAKVVSLQASTLIE